jgi:HD-GYP domain-containing protein (c-di-GMP phosphodiesterase class II)
MKKDLYSIRINTLRANDLVPFDVFIQIGERFVHYSRINEEMEAWRIKSLKGHGVKKLYIDPNHEPLYLSYLEQGLRTLENSDIAVGDRATMAHDTMITSVENAEKNLESESSYNGQKKQLELVSTFLSNESEALKIMLNAAGVSLDNNQHAATVSSLALAVANKIGRIPQQDVTDLGYAALLHDIGKTKLGFQANITLAKLPLEQMKRYKSHPDEAVAMLAGKPFVSPRILGLIASHEEYGQGLGYPGKKDLSRLELPYQILSMVNKFDHFCQDVALPATQAIDQFFEKHKENFKDELMKTLAEVLS